MTQELEKGGAVDMKLETTMQSSLSDSDSSGEQGSKASGSPASSHRGESLSPLRKKKASAFLRNSGQEAPRSVFSLDEFHSARLAERHDRLGENRTLMHSLSFNAFFGNSFDALESPSPLRRGSRGHHRGVNESPTRKQLKRGKAGFKGLPTDAYNKLVLVAVDVLGSAGSLRFLVAEDELVQRVIDIALQTYANQGRKPALGVDPDQFELYARSSDFEVLRKGARIGSLSSGRQFVLYRKPSPHQKLTESIPSEKQLPQNAPVLFQDQHQPPTRSLEDLKRARPALCTVLYKDPRLVTTLENQESKQSSPSFRDQMQLRRPDLSVLRQSHPSNSMRNWWAMLTAIV